MSDDPMSAGNCLWTDLEDAVCQTVNMAFMLEATVETDREFYRDRKEDAIAFGVYEVACRARKAQELYNKLHRVIREPASSRRACPPRTRTSRRRSCICTDSRPSTPSCDGGAAGRAGPGAR
jgi:hypothetical protein